MRSSAPEPKSLMRPDEAHSSRRRIVPNGRAVVCHGRFPCAEAPHLTWENGSARLQRRGLRRPPVTALGFPSSSPAPSPQHVNTRKPKHHHAKLRANDSPAAISSHAQMPPAESKQRDVSFIQWQRADNPGTDLSPSGEKATLA